MIHDQHSGFWNRKHGITSSQFNTDHSRSDNNTNLMSLCLTDIHDIVLHGIIRQPVKKQGQFGIGSRNRVSTCCQEPSNDSPSWEYVRTQYLIWRVNYTNDVANDISAQGLGLGSG
jgi:hypothetical protein